jgi:hypothetical protein
VGASNGVTAMGAEVMGFPPIGWSPTQGYAISSGPRPDGAAILRGRLVETAYDNAPAVADAGVETQWQDDNTGDWFASSALSATNTTGEFAGALPTSDLAPCRRYR